MSKRKKLFVVAAIILTAFVGYRAYLYSPYYYAGSNPKIENLIDQLASENQELEPYAIHDFLDLPKMNLTHFDVAKQQKVSDAYFDLYEMGKDAFPFLIKHMHDDRFSHYQISAAHSPVTVGQACENIIQQHLDLIGPMYKSRETPSGTIQYANFSSYVYANYGSYAAWHRNEKNLSMQEMRTRYADWRIKREVKAGFDSDEDRDLTIKSMKRKLKEAENSPDVIPQERWLICSIGRSLETPRPWKWNNE